MATAQSRGTSVVSTSGTTWATTANAWDGAVGTNPATYATFTNAASGGVGTIVIGGYTFAGPVMGATISSVSAAIRSLVATTSRWTSVTVQLQDSTGTAIGSAATATLSTSAHTDTLTVGTPTDLQVFNGLRVLVTATHSGTVSSVFSLDQVDLTVTYTAPPKVSTFSDNFATQDTTKWTGWGANASVVNQQLSLVAAPSSPGQITSNAVYDLTESSIYIRALQFAQCATSNYVPFRLASPNNGYGDYMEWGYIPSPTNGNAIAISVYVNGTQVYVSAFYTYDPVTFAWLRFRHTGGVVYFDASPDCLTWTNCGSWTVSGTTGMTNMYVALLGGQTTGTITVPNTIWDNLNTPPGPKISTFTDNFATQDVSKWAGWGSNASVSGGQLVLLTAASGSGIVTSVAVYDLTESAVYVQVVQFGQAATTLYAPFRLTSTNGLNYVEWARNDSGGALYMSASVFINNSNIVSNFYAYNSTSFAWLRIRHTANVIYFDASPDGVTWTNYMTWTNTILDITQLELEVFGGASSGTITVNNTIWDNLNVPPAPAASPSGFFALF
jgi:hypothetical protein